MIRFASKLQRLAALSLLPVAALLAAAPASAQSRDYPNKPVELVVPFQPGGGTDALARAFEEGEFATIMKELADCLSANAATQPAGKGPKSTALRLKDICQPLIPEQQITVDTNLLDINLKSLTLARIHEAIEREFPQRIEVTDLFDYPTLAQLAKLLDEPQTR